MDLFDAIFGDSPILKFEEGKKKKKEKSRLEKMYERAMDVEWEEV